MRAHHRRPIQAVLLISWLAGVPHAGLASQEDAIPPERARQVFAEAQAVCERDHGTLWGLSLCGPMLLVDPSTRRAVASQRDAEGRLAPAGEIFTGTLPPDVTIANTAQEWGGVHWTMFLWPLPEETYARARLMAHELFHRIQGSLGLPMSDPANAHLDSREGRIWLQLEWRALRRALEAPGPERREAVADALAFRGRRHTLFPGSAAEERALEMNEGLAEYTGVKLRGSPEPATIEYLADRLNRAHGRPSFVRAFAYETGPAYGLLLDGTGLRWRIALDPSADLGDLASRAFDLPASSDLAPGADERARGYDADTLRAAELAREEARNRHLAAYRARLVDGPVLVLPVAGAFRFSFDPNAVVPLGGEDTLLPTASVSDEWGVLEVTDGALLVRDGSSIVRVVVTAPRDPVAQPLDGDGWTLTLAHGWTCEPGQRPGDFVVGRR